MKINFPSVRKINKTWISLGVALSIGLLTALGARMFLSRQMEAMEARTKQDTVDIVVAKTEIAAGTKLGRENLAVRKVPVDFAQSGAVRPEDFSRIDGRAITYALRSGEMIMWSQMETQRPPTFSARLASGRRAITVVVDEINSISGMLEPGDLVDLMFAVDQNGQKMVIPLLQSVQVMATGQRVVDDPKSGEQAQFATVTLDTTPEQAKNIIIARETGKLTALLRNPNDKVPIGNRGLDLAALFGGRRPPVAHQATQVPVLYGGNGAKFPPEALRLARKDMRAPGATAPVIVATASTAVAAVSPGAPVSPEHVTP